MKNILLDTHTWIWFASEKNFLTKSINKIIDDAAWEHRVFLAEISLWEVAMLIKKQRITINMPCLEWIEEAIERCHIRLLSLTPEIAADSAYLPGEFHGDPADRIIVATARTEECQLLTRDEKILHYGKHKYVNTLKV